MITVTRRFTFDMAHRLDRGYQGLCVNLHGHTYICEVTFTSLTLDSHGMIIDFGDIKQDFQELVKEHLDHAVLCAPDDKELINWLKRSKQRYHVMPVTNCCTTAESMVEEIANLLQLVAMSKPEWCDRGLRLIKVRLHETQDSWAEWSYDPC
jgi:6-pyruvoyltetrahydropterin/6-carboxytetrahydropterin synthase